MVRIGLALSGGGLRATLFHLGVVRFLKDSDLLSSVTHITSVSGGSVLGAHLVLNWDRYNGSTTDFEEAAREVLDFARLDVRNRIVRRYPFTLGLSFLHRIARQRPPRQWTRTGLLEQHYRQFLYGDTCLFQLPVRPELHMLATNLSEGGLSSFTRSGVMMEVRGRASDAEIRSHRGGLATVPMAVAASSAFPGFFPPLELSAEDIGANAGEFQTQYFTDGGVYDNLGVRMFRYLERHQQLTSPGIDTTCLDAAVREWNRAVGSQTMTPLRRIAEIYDSRDAQGRQSPSQSPLLQESRELVTRIGQLISDTDLAKDEQLCSLLQGEQHGDERSDSRNGDGQTTARAASDSSNEGAMNRDVINLAFREAIGADLLTPDDGGFDAIIASDAGKTFQVTRPDRSSSFLRTAMRSSDILMDRVWQLEKDHFEAAEDFVFVPITRVVSQEEDGTAMHPEVQIQVSRMRTDMDRFTDNEVIGLVRHGYCVARQSVTDKPCLARHAHAGPPWDPITGPNPSQPADATQRSWRGRNASEATEQARVLQDSSRRKYLGVFLSPRDWVTYLYLPLLFFLLGVIPYVAVKFWHHTKISSTLTSTIAQTRPDFETLLRLIEHGSITPWQGMPFVEVDGPDPLFAERGLDIISDTRIADLRTLGPPGTAGVEDDASFMYVYRLISVRKLQHSEGDTALRLQWDLPAISVRCRNAELEPELRRSPATTTEGPGQRYLWQIKLDFDDVPVGHTTDVVVEAILSAKDLFRQGLPGEWWRFEVDADPEVVTAWLLLPDHLANRQPSLIRYKNDDPEAFEFVEPTHSSSVLEGSILNWTIVHPKVGYSYTYRWNSGL